MFKRDQGKEEEKGVTYQFPLIWKTKDGLIYGDNEDCKPSDKVLSFDMDGTLITTKGGSKFAKDIDDWTIINDEAVAVIKDYYQNKGYKIIIMTNQGGIETGHWTTDNIKKKIQNVVEFIGVPMQVFISAYRDYYRKPSPGMWNFFTENMNGGKEINLKESIYCGDAAGRPKEGTRTADYDNTDYKFALNAGLQFKTPEMLYFGIQEILPEIEFDPKTLPKTGQIIKGKDIDKIKGEGKEMILFVGPPGSGKTTFWRTYLSDYVHINKGILGEFSLKVTEQSLKDEKNVVIDNTNPHAETRKNYIDLAKKYGYTVRAFYFNVPKELAFHLDDLRDYNIHREHESKRVGKMVIHYWYKNFEMPETKEGIKEIETINFIPGPFKNIGDEKMFYCFVSNKI